MQYDKEKYMRAKELSEYLKIGQSTVWFYAKQKRITPKKISPGVTIFDVDAVEKSLKLK